MSQVDAKKRVALGKGIESLLGPRPTPAAPATVAVSAAAEPAGKPLEIELGRIDRNPNQTRTSFDEAKLAELAQSIEATGVVQPVVVRERPGGRYELIMGERRWRASQKAGKTTIPAIVRQVSDGQAMEMTIVENLQRADLNPMEQARAYERLSREFKLTQEQMAQRTGKDRASVANFLRLLKLPEETQALVESGQLSFGHARALLGLQTPGTIAHVTAVILAKSMSVRQTEIFIQAMLNPEEKPKKETAAKEQQDPNVHAAEEQLQRRLGLRVHIHDRKGKGTVQIEYSNVDEFDAILSALGEA
ncbi:MAG TPA: ParB/RepB/Spo0J family partition protein [Acidobacteriaceae bacterium]|nr:ParB/RepB/Spo0J family partition protein [Acidobacteriaceae bacterium]